MISRGLIELMFAVAGTWKLNSNAASFFTNLTVLNGRFCASYGMRVIEVSAAAIFA